MARDVLLERSTIAEGEFIFKEGQQGSVAYVIEDGEVEIVKTKDGEEVILGTVGKGGIFGEMALLDDQPRMAGARAAVSTTVIVITSQMFKAKLEKTDPFVRGLLNILAETIRQRS